MSYQPSYSSEPTGQSYREPDAGGQQPQIRLTHQPYQRQQPVEQPYAPDQVYSQPTVQTYAPAQAYPQQPGTGQPYPASQNQGYPQGNHQYQQQAQQEYSQHYNAPGHYGNQPPYSEAAPVGPGNGVVRRTDMGAVRAESRYETYRDPMGNLVESRQQVYEDQNQTRNNLRYWITTGITFVLTPLEVILFLRFIFRLLDANTSAGFITFLYGVSHPFVAAFNGIFNDQTLGKSGVFEASTLVAMVIYALIAWGLIALVRALFAPVQSSRQSVTTTRRSQM